MHNLYFYIKFVFYVYLSLGIVLATIFLIKDIAVGRYKLNNEIPLIERLFLYFIGLVYISLFFSLNAFLWPYIIPQRKIQRKDEAELDKRKTIAREIAREKLALSGGKTLPLLYDPLEDDPVAGQIIRKVGDQEKMDFEDRDKEYESQSYEKWGRVKKILKVEYGINWYDPSEMNGILIID